jgi:hypothetical protein
LDDVVGGAVGFAIGGFDFGDRGTGLSGAVVEEAVGERAADSLMGKPEEPGGAGALVSQAISITSAAPRPKAAWRIA